MKFLLWIPIFRHWYERIALAEAHAADLKAQLEAAQAELRSLETSYREDLRRMADFEAQRGTGRNIFARASESGPPVGPVQQPPPIKTARDVARERAVEQYRAISAKRQENEAPAA